MTKQLQFGSIAFGSFRRVLHLKTLSSDCEKIAFVKTLLMYFCLKIPSHQRFQYPHPPPSDYATDDV